MMRTTPARPRRRPVRRHRHEVELDREVDRAGEIAHEHERALEHADEQRRPARVVGGDLRARARRRAPGARSAGTTVGPSGGSSMAVTVLALHSQRSRPADRRTRRPPASSVATRSPRTTARTRSTSAQRRRRRARASAARARRANADRRVAEHRDSRGVGPPASSRSCVAQLVEQLRLARGTARPGGRAPGRGPARAPSIERGQPVVADPVPRRHRVSSFDRVVDRGEPALGAHRPDVGSADAEQRPHDVAAARRPCPPARSRRCRAAGSAARSRPGRRRCAPTSTPSRRARCARRLERRVPRRPRPRLEVAARHRSRPRPQRHGTPSRVGDVARRPRPRPRCPARSP